MKRALIVVLFCALLVSCTPKRELATSEMPSTLFYEVARGRASGVYRVVDAKAGVVCWIYVGYDKGGICCLPIEQTDITLIK